MKVLIIGGGGREHALAWKLKGSPRVTEILAVPGNAGIAELGRIFALEGGHEALIELAGEEGVGLTVVGPEAPLVSGLVDAFEAAGLRIFGPRQAAAGLEGSKRFAKAFMDRHNVPTAHHESFDDSLLAAEHLERARLPIVVKDSNLAAGKGVTVARTKAEAVQAARNILEVPEGGQIVIEEYLEGQELSLLAFCDGHTIMPMLPVQDYKQAHDGDRGPMTGGMGAVCPVPLGDDVMARLEEEVLAPTLHGLQAEGLVYKGVLYFGLMLTSGGPKVLEYNARFGDPETQVLLPLLDNDLLEVMEAVIGERLDEVALSWRPEHCACVVMASPGYPESYARGRPLLLPEGLPEGWSEDIFIFHAGTSLEEGRLVASGGRVLNVTARGPSLEAALRRAYTVVETVDFPGALYRKDIGYRLLGK